MQSFFRLPSALAAATLALAAALPLQATAAVLYSNPWADTPYGLQADVFVGPAATNVALGGPATVSGISWWGVYGMAGGLADDLFTVSFNGSTLAGTVSAISAAAANVPAYRYTLTLDEALLFGGGQVELAIVNGAGDVELEWFWLDAGSDPGGIPTDILPASLVIEGELQATPVPEPGVLTLFAGAGGAWMLLRRRRTTSGT